MQSTKPKKRGRKSLYTPEARAKAKNMAELGATVDEIASVIGINPGTLYEWQGRYPEFSELLKTARASAVEGVESALYRSAMGYTHWDEKIFCSKNGKITRVKFLRHYAPNPASMSLFLKAYKAGVYRDNPLLPPPPAPQEPSDTGLRTFEQFCEVAGYPEPYEKQVEMRAFGMDLTETRLLLGARGYGKTDYVTVLGVAYSLYCDFERAKKEKGAPIETNLIVTKSKERNAAIIEEIAKSLLANGVPLEKQNASVIRVSGLHGKDHSVSTITIGAKSVRGRHPKRTIMDDPVTEDDDSEATRKKVQKLFNELMKLCTNIVVIGQPVHKFDLYETLRPRIKKMEVTHGMIPDLDHDLEAQRLAGVSEESIQASYFLKVISEAGYPMEKVNVDLKDFPEGESSVAFIDPSHEGGDYTALTVVKAHFDGVAIYGKMWKRAWYDCLDEIGAVLVAKRVARLAFETNALGEQPLVMLRDLLPGIGVVGKHSTTHKHSRILAAGAFSKLIHIAKTSDALYIEQVRKYEYGAKHDDAPDSLASALEWIGLVRGKIKAT